jgi:hypothetical protein
LKGATLTPFAGALQALSLQILCILLLHSFWHFAGSFEHRLLEACLELLSSCAVKAVARKLREIISLPHVKHPQSKIACEISQAQNLMKLVALWCVQASLIFALG